MNLKRILASLTFKFMFSYVVGLSLVVFVVLALVFASFSYNYFRSVHANVQNESERLQAIYRQEDSAGLQRAFAAPQAGRNLEHFHYLLTDAQQRRIAGDLEQWPSESHDNWAELEYSVSFRDEMRSGDQLISKIAPLPDGNILVVVRNYTDFVLFEQIILAVLLRTMFVTIVLGAIGGAVVAGRSLRSMDTINRTVQSIMQGDLSQRVAVRNARGDFRRLATTFNRMLDRIQALMDGMRQVTDNIAHDLRTPLTRLRNHLASLQDMVDGEAQPTVQAVIDEADGLLATFNALLRIAQIESGQRIAGFQRLDLSQILHDVIELYEPLAAEKNIDVTAQMEQPLPVSGDRDLLFQAFANLLDNAIKYTPVQGAIQLSADVDGRQLRIEIADSGMGVPASELDKIFRRFYRVEASRSLQPGNGLGLSLVQAVINLHAGSIAAGDNQPGLTVTVRLPLAAN